MFLCAAYNIPYLQRVSVYYQPQYLKVLLLQTKMELPAPYNDLQDISQILPLLYRQVLQYCYLLFVLKSKC